MSEADGSEKGGLFLVAAWVQRPIDVEVIEPQCFVTNSSTQARDKFVMKNAEQLKQGGYTIEVRRF